jgi:hypothetical protein
MASNQQRLSVLRVARFAKEYWILLLCSISALVCAQHKAVSAGEPTTDGIAKMAWVFDGMRQRLASLKCGEFSCKGIIRRYDRTGTERGAETFDVYCEFSEKGERFLDSRTGVIISPITIPADADRERLERYGVDIEKLQDRQGLVETRAYRNDMETGHWRTGQQKAVIEVIVPGKRVDRTWDIKSIGLMVWTDFFQGVDSSACISSWQEASDFLVVDDGDGCWSVEHFLKTADTNLRWSMQIDATNGFTPKSLKGFIREPGSNRWVLHQDHHTQWENVSGTWVPKASHLQVNRLRDQSIQEALDLEFTWRSVNRRMPEDSYGIEWLSLPDEIGIDDFTHGDKVVSLREAAPLIPSAKARAAIDQKLQIEHDQRLQNDHRSISMSMIVLALVFMNAVILASIWVVRYRVRGFVSHNKNN